MPRRAQQAVGVDDLLHPVERLGRRLVAPRDLALALLVGIAHLDAQQEAVELRLGQGEGALQLDRVLGGQHQERVGERPRLRPRR